MGSSARFEMGTPIIEGILAGDELAIVIDRLSGETNVRSRQGAMGVITNGIIPRADSYYQALVFAFAKFISNPKYW